jgi:hypothetical protein
VLAVGLTVVASGLLLLFGCGLSCGSGAAAPLLIAIALDIVLIVTVVQVRRGRWDRDPGPDSGPDDPGHPGPWDGSAPDAGALLLPRRARELGWVGVGAGAGWVGTGVEVPEGSALSATAWGLVWTDKSWPADADGDGSVAGPGAPLPGAPAGSLVGRCGGRAFFVGSAQRLPAWAAGPLELAVNLGPGAAARAHGGLQVQVQAWDGGEG